MPKLLPPPVPTHWDERELRSDPASPLPGSPGQVAVALEYLDGEDSAPRVVASGKGLLAEQILHLAFANGVKVRTDPDLAQILSAVEVDSVIPLEAFAAVAEILAYIYRLNSHYQPTPP